MQGPDATKMDESQRTHLIETAQAVIGEWVETAYRIASATFGSDDTAAQKALDQMRHLHLAEPWLPATKIANRL